MADPTTDILDDDFKNMFSTEGMDLGSPPPEDVLPEDELPEDVLLPVVEEREEDPTPAVAGPPPSGEFGDDFASMFSTEGMDLSAPQVTQVAGFDDVESDEVTAAVDDLIHKATNLSDEDLEKHELNSDEYYAARRVTMKRLNAAKSNAERIKIFYPFVEKWMPPAAQRAVAKSGWKEKGLNGLAAAAAWFDDYVGPRAARGAIRGMYTGEKRRFNEDSDAFRSPSKTYDDWKRGYEESTGDFVEGKEMVEQLWTASRARMPGPLRLAIDALSPAVDMRTDFKKTPETFAQYEEEAEWLVDKAARLATVAGYGVAAFGSGVFNAPVRLFGGEPPTKKMWADAAREALDQGAVGGGESIGFIGQVVADPTILVSWPKLARFGVIGVSPKVGKRIDDALSSETRTFLDEHVTSGKLTQAEADKMFDSQLASVKSAYGIELLDAENVAFQHGLPGVHGIQAPRVLSTLKEAKFGHIVDDILDKAGVKLPKKSEVRVADESVEGGYRIEEVDAVPTYRAEAAWAEVMKEAAKRKEVPTRMDVEFKGLDPATGEDVWEGVVRWAKPDDLGTTAEKAFKRERLAHWSDNARTKLMLGLTKRVPFLEPARRPIESMLMLEKAQPMASRLTLTDEAAKDLKNLDLKIKAGTLDINDPRVAAKRNTLLQESSVGKKKWRPYAGQGTARHGVLHQGVARQGELFELARHRRNALDAQNAALFFDGIQKITTHKPTLNLALHLKELGRYDPATAEVITTVAKLDRIDEIYRKAVAENFDELPAANKAEMEGLLAETAMVDAWRNVISQTEEAYKLGKVSRKESWQEVRGKLNVMREVVRTQMGDTLMREAEVRVLKESVPVRDQIRQLEAWKKDFADMISNKMWTGATTFEDAMANLRQFQQKQMEGAEAFVVADEVGGLDMVFEQARRKKLLPEGTPENWAVVRDELERGLDIVFKEDPGMAPVIMEFNDMRARTWAAWNKLPPSQANAWYAKTYDYKLDKKGRTVSFPITMGVKAEDAGKLPGRVFFSHRETGEVVSLADAARRSQSKKAKKLESGIESRNNKFVALVAERNRLFSDLEAVAKRIEVAKGSGNASTVRKYEQQHREISQRGIEVEKKAESLFYEQQGAVKELKEVLSKDYDVFDDGGLLTADQGVPRIIDSGSGSTPRHFDTPEFKRFFGESKIVQGMDVPGVPEGVAEKYAKSYEPGAPLVAYHGSRGKKEGFESFDPLKAGTGTDSGWHGIGFYLSSSPHTAAGYSGGGFFFRDPDLVKSSADSVRYGAGTGFVPTKGEGSVLPAYLSIENPYYWGRKGRGVRGLVKSGERLPDNIHDAVVSRAGYSDKDLSSLPTEYHAQAEKDLARAITEELTERGHDGIVVDLINTGRGVSEHELEFIVFKPTQIKATSNLGAWGKDDPRLLFSRQEDTLAPLAYTQIQDGKAIIGVFENVKGREAFTAVMEEVGHIFRKDLPPADLKVAEDWVTSKHGMGSDAIGKDGRWTEAAEEAFARAFVKWVKTGEMPKGFKNQSALKEVFNKAKEWLFDVWQVMTGRSMHKKIDEAGNVVDVVEGARRVKGAQVRAHFEGAPPGKALGRPIKITDDLESVFQRLLDPDTVRGADSPLAVDLDQSLIAMRAADGVSEAFAFLKLQAAARALSAAAGRTSDEADALVRGLVSKDPDVMARAELDLADVKMKAAGRHKSAPSLEGLGKPEIRNQRHLKEVLQKDLVSRLGLTPEEASSILDETLPKVLKDFDAKRKADEVEEAVVVADEVEALIEPDTIAEISSQYPGTLRVHGEKGREFRIDKGRSLSKEETIGDDGGAIMLVEITAKGKPKEYLASYDEIVQWNGAPKIEEAAASVDELLDDYGLGFESVQSMDEVLAAIDTPFPKVPVPPDADDIKKLVGTTLYRRGVDSEEARRLTTGADSDWIFSKWEELEQKKMGEYNWDVDRAQSEALDEVASIIFDDPNVKELALPIEEYRKALAKSDVGGLSDFASKHGLNDNAMNALEEGISASDELVGELSEDAIYDAFRGRLVGLGHWPDSVSDLWDLVEADIGIDLWNNKSIDYVVGDSISSVFVTAEQGSSLIDDIVVRLEETSGKEAKGPLPVDEYRAAVAADAPPPAAAKIDFKGMKVPALKKELRARGGKVTRDDRRASLIEKLEATEVGGRKVVAPKPKAKTKEAIWEDNYGEIIKDVAQRYVGKHPALARSDVRLRDVRAFDAKEAMSAVADFNRVWEGQVGKLRDFAYKGANPRLITELGALKSSARSVLRLAHPQDTVRVAEAMEHLSAAIGVRGGDREGVARSIERFEKAINDAKQELVRRGGDDVLQDAADVAAIKPQSMSEDNVLRAQAAKRWLDSQISERKKFIRLEMSEARRESRKLKRIVDGEEVATPIGRALDEAEKDLRKAPSEGGGEPALEAAIEALSPKKGPAMKHRITDLTADPELVIKEMSEHMDRVLKDMPKTKASIREAAKQLGYDLRTPGELWEVILNAKKWSRSYGDELVLRKETALEAFRNDETMRALDNLDGTTRHKVERLLENRKLYGVSSDASPAIKALAKDLGMTGTEELFLHVRGKGRRRVGEEYTSKQIEDALKIAVGLDGLLDDQLKKLQANDLFMTIDPTAAPAIDMLRAELSRETNPDRRAALDQRIKEIKNKSVRPWSKEEFLTRAGVASYIPHLKSTAARAKTSAMSRGGMPTSKEGFFEKRRTWASTLDDINEQRRIQLATESLYHNAVNPGTVSSPSPAWGVNGPFAGMDPATVRQAAITDRLEELLSVDDWEKAVAWTREQVADSELYDFFEADFNILIERYLKDSNARVSDAKYLNDMRQMFPIGQEIAKMVSGDSKTYADLRAREMGYSRLTRVDSIEALTGVALPPELRAREDLIKTRLLNGEPPEQIVANLRAEGINVDVVHIESFKLPDEFLPTPIVDYIRWINKPDWAEGKWYMGWLDGIQSVYKSMATISSIAHIGMNAFGNEVSIAQKLGTGIFNPANHGDAMMITMKMSPEDLTTFQKNMGVKHEDAIISIGDHHFPVKEWRRIFDELGISESANSRMFLEEMGGKTGGKSGPQLAGAGLGAGIAGLGGFMVGGPIGAAAAGYLGQYPGALIGEIMAKGLATDASKAVSGVEAMRVAAREGWDRVSFDEMTNFREAIQDIGTKAGSKKFVKYFAERSIGMTAGASIGSVFGPPGAVAGAIAGMTIPSYMKMMTGLNQAVETQARITLAIGEIRKGKTFQQAADSVDDALRNYSHLSPLEKHVFRRMFFFYTWDAGNIRFQMHEMVKNPRQLAVFSRFLNMVYKGQFTPEEIQSMPAHLRWKVVMRTGPQMLYAVNGFPQAAWLEMMGKVDDGSPAGFLTRLRPEFVFGLEFIMDKRSLYYGRGWDKLTNVRQLKNASPILKSIAGMPAKPGKRMLYKNGKHVGWTEDYRAMNPENFYAMTKLPGWRILMEQMKLQTDTFTSRALEMGDESALATPLQRTMSFMSGNRPYAVDFDAQRKYYEWALLEQLWEQVKAQDKSSAATFTRGSTRIPPRDGPLVIPSDSPPAAPGGVRVAPLVTAPLATEE